MANADTASNTAMVFMAVIPFENPADSLLRQPDNPQRAIRFHPSASSRGALRHAVQKRRGLAVEEFDVGRNGAPGRRVAGDGAGTDRHYLDACDIPGGGDRLEFR